MSSAADQLAKFKSVIATGELPLLGPQRRPGTLSEAEMLRKLEEFFAAERIPERPRQLLHSAALLWHDHLDASHTISQAIETRDGSWLHGIMHRREPDYGNAKYWFHRVGAHPAFPKLAAYAAALMRKHGDPLFGDSEWDPFAFIDECEAAEQGEDSEVTAALRQIQATEFDVLVEHILSSAP